MMKNIFMVLGVLSLMQAWAAPVLYNFNDFEEGPVDGHQGWNVYNKVPDSSAFSVVSGVGKNEESSDKGLVIKTSAQPLRLVAPAGISWMPGETCRIEFDFKAGVPARDVVVNRPVLIVFIGDKYLTNKARWAVRLEITSDGTWQLVGGMPDWQSVNDVPASAIVVRPESEGAAVSEWMRFILVSKKLAEPDSFESSVEILDKDGNVIISRKFGDKLKNKMTADMWNLSRLYFGFNISKKQFGLACVDNIQMTTSK